MAKGNDDDGDDDDNDDDDLSLNAGIRIAMMTGSRMLRRNTVYRLDMSMIIWL